MFTKFLPSKCVFFICLLFVLGAGFEPRALHLVAGLYHQVNPALEAVQVSSWRPVIMFPLFSTLDQLSILTLTLFVNLYVIDFLKRHEGFNLYVITFFKT